MTYRFAAIIRRSLVVLFVSAAPMICVAASAASSCRKVVFKGEVSAGQTWQSDLGQGWMFRVQPIQGGYSGWDLVVDRNPPAGYPDALLLATPPYSSISEREIGTTFGLRAQDAIGWMPRTFHFLIDPAAFREAQRLYLTLARDGGLSGKSTGGAAGFRAIAHLLGVGKNLGSGEFRIEDARLIPGVADPAHFAEAWTLAATRVPHEIVPAEGKSSPRGSFVSMRFSVTLWLPASWRFPQGVSGTSTPCGR